MDKLLIITGGSRGIGLAAADLFSKDNYRVINLSRTNTRQSAAEHIASDFSDPSWALNIKASLLDFIGQPDQISLIHNAATMVKDDIRKAPDFSEVLQVNLVAPQQLNELVIPLMKKGSSILYVGSTLSKKAVSNTLTYSASKHGLLGLMRATTQDLFGAGIHTACIRPGFTDTEMLRSHVGDDPETLNVLVQSNAFGRLVKPEEIATTLKFCADNPAINGTSIDANLGQKEF